MIFYLPKRLLSQELKLISSINLSNVTKTVNINKLRIEPFLIHKNKYTDELNILWGYYKNNDYFDQTPPNFTARYKFVNNEIKEILPNELQSYNWYEAGQLLIYNHFHLPKEIKSGDILLFCSTN